MKTYKIYFFLSLAACTHTDKSYPARTAWLEAVYKAIHAHLSTDDRPALRKCIKSDAEIVNLQQPASKMTPLMMAAFLGKLNCMLLLIQHKAKLETVNGNGKTALMHAVASSNETAVRLLLDHGASTAVVSRDGNTALSIAQRSASQKRKPYNDAFGKIAKLLQESSATQKNQPAQAPGAPQIAAAPQS